MRAIWLLHNVRAGQKAFRRGVDQAAEALARRGVRVQLVREGDLGRLREAARRAVAAGADAVLVAGGDGTLGAIAGELAGSPVALGGLPAGTANTWSRELGLPIPAPWRPRALEQAALLLLDSPVLPTDLGRANDRPFLAWAGLGLDAYMTQQYEAHRTGARPLGGYLYNTLLTFRVASGFQPVDVRVRVSGPAGERELSGRYAMVTGANIGLHGGGWLRLAPDARLDDGLLDLWAFAAGSHAEIAAHAWRVARGRHLGHPGVTRLTAERIDLYTPALQVYQVDAEPMPATQHVAVRVEPRCLRVLVPPAAARRLYRAAPIREPGPA